MTGTVDDDRDREAQRGSKLVEDRLVTLTSPGRREDEAMHVLIQMTYLCRQRARGLASQNHPTNQDRPREGKRARERRELERNDVDEGQTRARAVNSCAAAGGLRAAANL